MNSKHQWEQNQTWGVASGSGRPHGVDESWTCTKCGARKTRGPENTASGKRVIRWHYTDAYGYASDQYNRCIGHSAYEQE